MGRTDDIRVINNEGGLNVIDLTPTPLTTVGVGPWVRCPGVNGWAQVILSDTVGATASVSIEATNERDEGGEDTLVAFDPLSQASKRGRGAIVITYPVWVRLRVSEIAGGGSVVGNISLRK